MCWLQLQVSDLPLQERPMMQQLKSLEFFVLLIFASVSLTRANMYIGTQDLLLDYLGDDSSTYAKVFSLVLPCGPLLVPAIEWYLPPSHSVLTLP